LRSHITMGGKQWPPALTQPTDSLQPVAAHPENPELLKQHCMRTLAQQ